MRTVNVIEGIYFAALEKKTPDERLAYLEEACKGDEALRRCVDRMLESAPKVGNFLEPTAPGLPTTEHPPITERPGTVIGHYKLLQHLGEGGFGVVFLAEQQEPVRRKVALKVIKPGMDSKQVVARFEAERQALALMDHPNIARVLDGGTTDSGRPYFVMELVKGVPITDFCDQNRLSPRERLELFVSVCQAVQHAHQKGIIHRDLKPSNVLVTMYDDNPVPKVIDFGVAKAIEQRLTEQTLFTRVGQVIGTFEYMSPEQASLNALDVDTRSDVYALGVLLYELLTGSTPLEKEKLRSAAFMETLRLIREEEPPRPSVRLSGSGHGLPLLAAYRKTESQKLPELVRGGLDWIAMKALEKDRGRRYGTATALAADVQRYLKDEPVEACPPSLAYRMRKFARKHKAAFTLTGTAAALLLLGTVVSGWQAVRAMRAHQIALNERDDADHARKVAADAREVAEREAESANAAREQIRRHQYHLAMNLVQNAMGNENILRAVELLDQQRPRQGEEDQRHWEWHYWDRQLHQQRRTVTVGQSAGSLVLSENGRRVAFRHFAGKEENPILKVVETATGKEMFSPPLTRSGTPYTVFSLSLSRDGGRGSCVVGSWVEREDKNRVVVWDVASRKELFAREGSFLATALSPDGKSLATVEGPLSHRSEFVGGQKPLPHTAKVWDLGAADEEPLFSTRIEAVTLGKLVFSPDGSRLATVSSLPVGSGSFGQESMLQVWDTKTGRPLQNQPRSYVVNVAFSADGTRLAGIGPLSRQVGRFGNEGLQSYLWSCAGDELKQLRATPLPLPGVRGPVSIHRMAYSPDGRWLAVWHSLSPTIGIFDAATGAKVESIRSRSLADNVAFNQEGTRLYTVGRASPSRRGPETLVWQEWDIKAGEPPPAPRPRPREVVVWSPDGERQAVFARRAPGDEEALRATITVRDRAGKTIHVFRDHPESSRVFLVRFSPDGRLIYSTAQSDSRNYRIWEADTGKVLWSHQAPPRAALSEAASDRAAFSRDGRLIVLPDDKERKVVRFGDDLPELFSVGMVTNATFSPDARRLVTVLRRMDPAGMLLRVECKLWDVESGRVIRSLPVGAFRPVSGGATFSPDGRSFCVGSSSPEGVTLWDTDTGAPRLTLKPGSWAPDRAVFSPDGLRLVTHRTGFILGESNAPIVWDLTTGKELCRLEGHGGLIVGSVAFSPDGKRIASSSGSGEGSPLEIKLWDAATGRELLSLVPARRGSTGPNRLAFSDDGHKLLLLPPQVPMARDVPTEVLFDATPRAEGK